MITPDIFADIKFYSQSNGGRCMPTPTNFFSCIFIIDGNNHDGRLLLEEIGQIVHGDMKENVPIKFLYPDLMITINQST